jgi:hypothetical protein
VNGDGVHLDEMFEDDPDLAAFARDLRAAADQGPLPEIGAALAAVLDGRAPANEVPGTVGPPGSPRRGGTWSRRRRAGVAVGAGLGLAFGSLGVAGALPGPVQRQVARAADVVGIDLPGDGEPADVSNLTPPTSPPTTESMARSTTTAGDDGDGPGRDGRGDDDRGDDQREDRPGRADEDHGTRGAGHGEDDADDAEIEDRGGSATTVPGSSGHGREDGEDKAEAERRERREARRAEREARRQGDADEVELEP